MREREARERAQCSACSWRETALQAPALREEVMRLPWGLHPKGWVRTATHVITSRADVARSLLRSVPIRRRERGSKCKARIYPALSAGFPAPPCFRVIGGLCSSKGPVPTKESMKRVEIMY